MQTQVSSLVIGILKQSGSYGVLDENKQNKFSFDTCLSNLTTAPLQKKLGDTALNRGNPYFCTGNLSLS